MALPLFTSHRPLLEAAYSDLKRRALEQRFVLVGSPGSVGTREVNGRPFVYRQFYDARGRKASEYLGPAADPASLARADALREQIEVARGLSEEARMLAREGYVRIDGRTAAVAAALHNDGLFRAGAVLVGSHAYGALLNEIGVRAAAFTTEDVDVARGRGLDRTLLSPGKTFAATLAASTVALSAVPSLDRRHPPTSYKAAGRERFRVDLLAPTRKSEVGVVEVPELAAHATARPHLWPLLDRPIDAILLGREAVVPVKVPRPEALAWHKVLLTEARGAARDKRQKDATQAAVLFAALVEREPESLESAFADLAPSARSLARRGGKHVRAQLESSPHARASEVLARFIGG